MPAKAVDDVLADHGPALAGKVVIDATNRMADPVANSHERDRGRGAGRRGYGARLQHARSGENFSRSPPPAPTCSSPAHRDARADTEELIAAVGLRPVYVGGPEASGAVDALLRLWIALVQQRGGNRHFAFRLVER